MKQSQKRPSSELTTPTRNTKKSSSNSHPPQKTVPKYIFINKAATFLSGLAAHMSSDKPIPQSTLAIATSCLHRFYMTNSHTTHAYYEIGAGCLMIAAKVDDWFGRQLSLRRIIAYTCRKAAKNEVYFIDDSTEAGRKTYRRWCDVILNAEQSIACGSNFEFDGYRSYELVESLCKDSSEDAKTRCFKLLDDCYRSDICVRFTCKQYNERNDPSRSSSLTLRYVEGVQ